MSQKRSDRLFNNKILEALTHTHIAVPLTIFYGTAVGLVAFSLYYGTIAPLSNLWLFLGGLFVFTFVEYLVHRYAFHIDTDTPAKAKFQYTFHGVHHDNPRDKSRLAMPPVASVTLAAILFIGYRLVLGYYGLAVYSGFPGWLRDIPGCALLGTCIPSAEKLPEDTLGTPCGSPLQGARQGFRCVISFMGRHIQDNAED